MKYTIRRMLAHSFFLKAFLIANLLAMYLDLSAQVNNINSIDLFAGIAGVYPGHSSMSEVEEILGQPDTIFIAEDMMIGDTRYPGNCIMQYINLGITLIFSENVNSSSIVQGIYVAEPYQGISKEGIKLAMSRESCLRILNEAYVEQDNINNESFLFSKKAEAPYSLQVWFSEDILTGISVSEYKEN